MNTALTMNSTRSALILIPGSVNYFYNQCGRRVAEALRTAGWLTELATLNDEWRAEYDWVVAINVSELIVSRRAQGDGITRLREARQRCKHLAQVLLDCATTNWFSLSARAGVEISVDAFFDLGLHDQSANVPTSLVKSYHFIFNGLTPSELSAVELLQKQAPYDNRPIPWAVVGHQTPTRIKLTAQLLKQFDPRGFCYLPQLEPVTEDGPHLNEQQFHRVLERSRYHVWCSHHNSFYLESERFRAALLAGAIPIKVMLNDLDWRNEAAGIFDYLIFDERDFTTKLRAIDFPTTQRRFLADFRQRPSLTESLLAAMQAVEALQ